MAAEEGLVAAASMANPALAWVNAGSQLLNAVGGLGGKSAQPGVSTSGNAPIFATADLDFSGFTVATGGSKANGATIDKVSSNAAGSLPSAISELSNVSPLVILACVAGAAVLWKLTR